MRGTAPLEHHGVDARLVQQRSEQQSGGPGANDGDLGPLRDHESPVNSSITQSVRHPAGAASAATDSAYQDCRYETWLPRQTCIAGGSLTRESTELEPR